MTYTLTLANGGTVPTWMIWTGSTQVLQGLVPQSTVAFTELKMTGTDKDGLTCSSNFKLYYQSKPYLNNPLKNFEIRTEALFYYVIPPNTFVQPNNLKMTLYFYNIPSWMTFKNDSMTFSGRPSQYDVGTYVIEFKATDTKNESASTTFSVEVQKNYVPVVQR